MHPSARSTGRLAGRTSGYARAIDAAATAPPPGSETPTPPPPGPDPGTAPPPPRARPWPPGHRLTAFQQAVVDAVAALAPGDLVTYREVAEEVGRPGSGQAVANVLRSCPDLPWWRVLPSDGRLYCSHAPRQAPLLEAEGHRIDEHRRVHPGGSERRAVP